MDMHDNHHNCIKSRYAIDERRRQVAVLLSRCKTETEIGAILGVDQGTISRDVRALNQMSQRFIFDLAQSSLPRFYYDCILGVESVKRRAWDIADKPDVDDKTALAALKLAKECDVARFELFQSGPNVLNLDSLQSKIDIIVEKGNGSINGSQDQEHIRSP